MKLTIPTWLVFLFLGIASFAPIVSLRPRWWAPYYGAMLVCWVLVSVAAMRRVARRDQKPKRKLARMLRQLRDAKNADAVRHALAEERLIIVARDEAGLYDYIRRRDQFGDETVRVVTDRRSTDRRLRIEAHIPDRRRGERRRYDIDPLLLTQGWAEVTLPES
jgi:membrane protein implicated in regulation of membrane protease activity